MSKKQAYTLFIDTYMYVGAVEEIMCVVCVGVIVGHSGDRCDLALNVCMYDFKKGSLFVMGSVMVRRVRIGSIS